MNKKILEWAKDCHYQTLEYRWTVSRGAETYGWNICTLYANSERVSSTNGGGYDLQGVCLAEYLKGLIGLDANINGAAGLEYVIQEAMNTGKVKIDKFYLPKDGDTVIKLELIK